MRPKKGGRYFGAADATVYSSMNELLYLVATKPIYRIIIYKGSIHYNSNEKTNWKQLKGLEDSISKIFLISINRY